MNNLEQRIIDGWVELNKEDSAKMEIMGTIKELLSNKDEVTYCRIVLIFKNKSSSFKITNEDNIPEKLIESMKALGIKH